MRRGGLDKIAPIEVSACESELCRRGLIADKVNGVRWERFYHPDKQCSELEGIDRSQCIETASNNFNELKACIDYQKAAKKWPITFCPGTSTSPPTPPTPAATTEESAPTPSAEFMPRRSQKYRSLAVRRPFPLSNVARFQFRGPSFTTRVSSSKEEQQPSTDGKTDKLCEELNDQLQSQEKSLLNCIVNEMKPQFESDVRASMQVLENPIRERYMMLENQLKMDLTKAIQEGRVSFERKDIVYAAELGKLHGARDAALNSAEMIQMKQARIKALQTLYSDVARKKLDSLTPPPQMLQHTRILQTRETKSSTSCLPSHLSRKLLERVSIFFFFDNLW